MPEDERTDSGKPPELADDVLREIRRVVQSVTLSSRRFFSETGLTVPQLLCLRAIGDAEPEEITAAGVARAVHLSPATVTGILDRLEREGFLERVRHAQDRRKVCLFLSPKGRERLESIHSPYQERFLERFARLEECERRALLAELRRLVTLLGAQDIDASPILVTGDVKATTAG